MSLAIRRGAMAIGVAVACIACNSQWTVATLQPPLVLDANPEARTSIPLAIQRRDMEIPRWIKLENSAYFVVVSRDRLRFRVSFDHKWDDHCDLRNWSVYVEDARGVRHQPERIEQARVRPLYRGQRKALYRGRADLTIYERDIFRAVDKITLVISRPGYEYRYTWISTNRDS